MTSDTQSADTSKLWALHKPHSTILMYKANMHERWLAGDNVSVGRLKQAMVRMYGLSGVSIVRCWLNEFTVSKGVEVTVYQHATI